MIKKKLEINFTQGSSAACDFSYTETLKTHFTVFTISMVSMRQNVLMLKFVAPQLR